MKSFPKLVILSLYFLWIQLSNINGKRTFCLDFNEFKKKFLESGKISKFGSLAKSLK